MTASFGPLLRRTQKMCWTAWRAAFARFFRLPRAVLKSAHQTSSFLMLRVLVTTSLLTRELTRFYRQPSRVIGVFGLPLVMWIVLGLGFNDLIQIAGSNYLRFFFPGSILMVVLFTTIFSNISIIEDRNSGFLQGVLVSPIPRSALVAGKTLGTAALGVLQGTLLLMALWSVTGFPNPGSVVLAVLSLVLNSILLSCLGFWFAWRLDSVHGFHGIMNLILMPMWILSGALFPLPETGPVRLIMLLNPLAYGLELLNQALKGNAWTASAIFVVLGFTVLFVTLSIRVTQVEKMA